MRESVFFLLSSAWKGTRYKQIMMYLGPISIELRATTMISSI